VITTTPRQRAALLSAFPELLNYALPAVRLHPRPGRPEPKQSSVGGPLLWPRNEQWPTCTDPHSIDKSRPMTREEIDQFELRRRQRALSSLARLESLGEQMPAEAKARFRAKLEAMANETSSAQPDRQEPEAESGLRVHWSENETPAEPVALIPAVQLFRCDASDFPFPEDADLLQILWCPNTHQAWRGPRPMVFWRNSAELGELLQTPPPCSMITYEYYVPRPCLAHPEPLVEFPPICTLADPTSGEPLGQIPSELEQRLRQWEAARSDGEGYSQLAHAPGWKIGGWDGSWPDAAHLETCACGARMRPLLEVDYREWLGGTWSPHQEPHFPWGEPGRWQDEEPTGVNIGRNGMYWIHACTADPTHPLTHGLE
jgi:hypothetical protein